MLRSIVVPLDGTPHSEEALPFAARISRATGACLHLVRVLAPHVQPANSGAYPHEGTGLPPVLDDPDEGAVAEYLDRMTADVAGWVPYNVDSTLLEGEVTPALRRYALDVEADGMVLSTRAPGPLGRILLGSVADELIRAVDIPILAVQAGVPDVESARLCPMLVAIDGSEASECILHPVTGLALALEARVTLLHVLPAEGAGGGLPFHLPGDWERTMRDGEDYVDRIRDRLRRRGLRVETVVMAHPSPGRAICEVADEIDAGLVALGTHGRSGLMRAILGSVTSSVMTHAPRPLLVRRVG